MLSPENNSLQLLLQTARTHPNRVALVHKNERIPFAILQNRIEATAARFREKGIQKNDPVLVFVPVGIPLYVQVMALLYVGAVPVFVDEWANKERIRQCCETVNPKALLAPWPYRWLAYFFTSLRRIPLKLAPSTHAVSGQRIPLVAVDTDDPALITFTTGSTGTPKAAIRSHAILKAQFEALSPLVANDSTVCLTLLPIVVLLNLGLGKTTVISRISPKKYKPSDTQKLLLLIQKEQIDTVIASPFLIIELATYFRQTGQVNPSIKTIITGGGPVFPTDAALVGHAFPQAVTTIVYGSTEAEPISQISAATLAEWPDVSETGLPVGTVDAAATVAIMPTQEAAWPPMTETQWQQYVMRTSTVGEIVVSGNHVVKQYVKNEKARSETKIRVGQTIWHRTGDAGRLDAHGQLFLYGRCRQVMQLDNQLVYPFLVEYEARQFQGIRQAAFLLVEGNPLLAFSTTHEYHEQTFVEWARNRWGRNLRLKRYPAIPLDARHRTKVDYAALETMIGKK